VSLPEPTALLARLAKPTDEPTGLGLVLLTSRHLAVLNLDTGGITLIPRSIGAVYPLGASRVIEQHFHDVSIFDLQTRRETVLASGRFVQPSGVDPDGLWVRTERGVRRFDAGGRPHGGWHLPPTAEAGFGPIESGAALLFDTAAPSFVPQLWYPASGRTVQLPQQCVGESVAGGGRFVLLPCRRHQPATVIDPGTGRSFAVNFPPNASTGDMPVPISPDGRRLAVTLAAGYGGAAVVDLHDGVVTRAPGPGDLTPASWSPDGQWLLLANTDFGSSNGPPRLVLWHSSSPREYLSVRLPGVRPQPSYLTLVDLP
jgi:hypothetical protein